MSRQHSFMAFLAREGETATVTRVTGDACPCWNWRGTGYSKEYHRLPGSEPDCNGTGLQNASPAQTTVKALFYEAGLMAASPTPDVRLPVGELETADLVMLGCLDTSDQSFEDLSDLEERKDKVTRSSVDYVPRKVYGVTFGGDIGQAILLKKK